MTIRPLDDQVGNSSQSKRNISREAVRHSHCTDVIKLLYFSAHISRFAAKQLRNTPVPRVAVREGDRGRKATAERGPEVNGQA
jgi:hypothetical protein